MKHKQKVIRGLLILLAIALVLVYVNNVPTQTAQTTAKTSVNADAFVKCLTQKGATMYGASWCPHCKAQKEMFGTSVKYLSYVECAADDGSQTVACEKAGIKAYPTWIINGEKTTGQLSFVVLSEKSGCSLDLIK